MNKGEENRKIKRKKRKGINRKRMSET